VKGTSQLIASLLFSSIFFLANDWPFSFRSPFSLYFQSTLKCDYEYKNYISGLNAVCTEKDLSTKTGTDGKGDIVRDGITAQTQNDIQIEERSHISTISEDDEAIICDEDSFDEMFKSSGCDSNDDENGSPPTLKLFNMI
jgi:hypothetical protein